jgi:acetyl esterase/lipase
MAYATTSGSQILDLYLPAGKGPFPLIVNIHGGAFKFGDKTMVDPLLGKPMLEHGYTIASIDDPISGKAKYPAGAQDAKAAVRFLHAVAAEYNLNPNQFVAFVGSTGANIAAMVGTTSGISKFDDPKLGNAGVSSSVQVAIDWFGPTDFAQMDLPAKAQGCSVADQSHSNPVLLESLFLGKPVPQAADLVKMAKRITYITKNAPPHS